jgi:ABC-type transport system substrate-binding protein
MDRREWLAATAALAAAPAASAVAPRDPRTLRVAFRTAETGFDPPQVSDVNSSMVVASIFEAPLTYDYLARPVKLKPQTAVALPEVSADFRRFTFRIRPGIFFADDPAFGGKPRELTAQDFASTRSSASTTRSSTASTCTCSRTRRCSACPRCASAR